jgi:Tfp pilus assembly protein PilZ
MKITSIGIPSRVIETKTYEGTYTIKPTGNITVGNQTIQMYSLVYENYPFYLAMENGALFRKTNGNYTILEPPLIVTSGNTTIVAVIELYGDLATAGKGVLRIRLSNLENVRQNITTNNTIVVQSSHVDAWKDFFESAGFQIQSYDHANGTVIAKMNTSDMFVVKVVPVRMEFLR